jgi:hypothetical protein
MDRVNTRYDSIIHRVVQGANEDFLPLMTRLRCLEATIQVLQTEARTDPVNPYHPPQYATTVTQMAQAPLRTPVMYLTQTGTAGGYPMGTNYLHHHQTALVLHSPAPRAHPYHSPRRMRQQQGGRHHLNEYHHRPVGY